MSVNNAYEIAQQEFDHVADMLDLDEEALPYGSALYTACALKWLQNSP